MLNSKEENYDRMYYSYADKSFTKMTQPKLLFDWGYATIDADINLLEDGLYHMLIKKEGSQPGDTLRIKGKGINNPDSWKKGDFYCILKLVIPTSLSRKQKSLLEELEETDLEDEVEFKRFNKLNK